MVPLLQRLTLEKPQSKQKQEHGGLKADLSVKSKSKAALL
jgi:hypothetical protein